MSAATSGRVLAVHVTEGVHVEKGSRLATLDPDEAAAGVEAARAALAQAVAAAARADREAARAPRPLTPPTRRGYRREPPHAGRR